MAISTQEIKNAVKEALAEENEAGIQPIIIPPLADEVCQAWESDTAGGAAVGSGVNTNEVVAKFLASKAANLSNQSIQSYQDTLVPFARHFPTLPDKPESIEEYLSKFNNKNTTAKNKFNTLRVFYRWVEARLDLPNPIKMVQKPRGQAEETEPFNEEQAKALLFEVPKTDREQGFVYAMLGQGFRLGEVIGLNVGDIREDKIWLEKGKERKEWAPLLPEVRDVLLRLANGRAPNEPVFIGLQGRLSDSTVQLGIRKLLQRTGIYVKRPSPHTLRHTFSTLAYLAGCDWDGVELLMRHKVKKNVTNCYIHLSHEQRLRIMQQKLERYSPLRTLNGSQQGFSKKPDYA